MNLKVEKFRAELNQVFDDVKFVLECDRKGNSDFVSIAKLNTLLCESSFIPQDILMQYGYEMVRGGKTDVVELKPRVRG